MENASTCLEAKCHYFIINISKLGIKTLRTIGSVQTLRFYTIVYLIKIMQTFDQDGDVGLTDLSQNEARVLHSLVRWPDLTDQAIHSEIGMKKSTFSSIKTRLKEQNYYTHLFVPNFPKIGFELMLVMFGQLNRFTTYEERMRIAGDTVKSFTEDFYGLSESNKSFTLSVSENYTEYAKNLQKFLSLYAENKFLSKEGMITRTYPFELSRIYSFLDYESLLAKNFGFISEEYEKRITIPTGPTKVAKLSRAERKVLAGLVKYPEETDTLIADEVGHSQRRIAHVDDSTGLEIHSKLVAMVRSHPRIRILEYHSAIDLVHVNEQVAGAYFVLASETSFFVTMVT